MNYQDRIIEVAKTNDLAYCARLGTREIGPLDKMPDSLEYDFIVCWDRHDIPTVYPNDTLLYELKSVVCIYLGMFKYNTPVIFKQYGERNKPNGILRVSVLARYEQYLFANRVEDGVNTIARPIENYYTDPRTKRIMNIAPDKDILILRKHTSSLTDITKYWIGTPRTDRTGYLMREHSKAELLQYCDKNLFDASISPQRRRITAAIIQQLTGE